VEIWGYAGQKFTPSSTDVCKDRIHHVKIEQLFYSVLCIPLAIFLGDLFEWYVSSLPSPAHPFLKYMLVQYHDLLIVQGMLQWEKKLAPCLGLTAEDISHIKEICQNEQEQRLTSAAAYPYSTYCFLWYRQEALRRWRSRLDTAATYGQLLQLSIDAGHTQCAEAVYEVLKDEREFFYLS